ncbi:MAG: hypothetical protein QOG65_592 [Actinomycetota bacterium]|nr:hypothetical protein [Actinomycetota bacterium]
MITFLIVGAVVVNLVVLWMQVRRRRQIVAVTREMDRASLALIETAQRAIEATGTQIVASAES